MATIPKKPRPEPPRPLPPTAPAPALRTLVELPPDPGYLDREVSLLPSAGELVGNEGLVLQQNGRAVKGNLQDVLQMTRGLVDKLLQDNAIGRQVGGGGGRHTFERSVSRSPAVTPEAADTLLLVRDGKTVKATAGDLSLLAGDMEKSVYDTDNDGVVDNSERLGGELPVYYLPAASYTAADVLTKLLTVDGTGSGLDADLLDGQSSAYYRDRANHTGSQAISTITSLQSELDLKAPLDSPAFINTPTAPTQTAGNSSTRLATTAFVATAIANLIASAPGVLDTLDEIAAALGDDPNFAATMTTALAGKLAKASNLSDLTDAATARTNLGASATGDSLFTVASAAAARTLLGLVIGTDVAAQSHVGSGGTAHANAVASGAAGFLTGTDKAKLDGIASGATANSSDATLLARANHTGTQTASTISDFSEAVEDRVGTLLVAGSNISLNYNDGANTLTITGTGGGTGTVTSITAGPGLSSGGSPVTTSGTISVEGTFGYRNRIINPSGQINQLGVGSQTDGTYDFDQWLTLTQTAAVTVSQQTAVENGTPFMMRSLQAQASAQRFGRIQWLENAHSIDLRGQGVVLSARVRMSASTTLRYAIVEWTGTADSITKDVVNDWTSGTFTTGNFFTSTTTTVTATGSTALTANTLATISLAGTIGSSANNIAVFFWTDSTQAQNVTLDIGKVQLEIGTQATALAVRPFLTELMLCQRYVAKTFSYATTPGDNVTQSGSLAGSATLSSGSIAPTVSWRFPVEMMKAATTTLYNVSSGTAGQWNNTNGTVGANARTVSASTTGVIIENTNVTLTGTVNSYYIHAVAKAQL